MNKTLGVVLVVILVIATAGAYLYPKVQTENPPLRGAGPLFLDEIDFAAGVVNSGIVATTSQGATITIKASEFAQWAKASLVEFKQGLVANTTLTFPASTSVPQLVPRAGDRQTFCIRNATSTASLEVNLAGSTGINLNVASSTATALGSAKLSTGEVGCITLIRQAATASSFDIDALLTVYK